MATTAASKPQFLKLPKGEVVAADFAKSLPPRHPSKARSNHASTLGDICERRLVYRQTRGDEAEPISPGLQGIFATGDMVTPLLLANLNKFGAIQTPKWEILERERLIDDAQFAKWNIGCKLDGVRHVAATTGRMWPYNVVEFKTVNSNIHKRVKSLDDIGVTPWLAKAPDQLMIGMLGSNLAENPGWLVLINKENLFDLTILEIPFDIERAETLLGRAERINRHIVNTTLPRQINRPDVCLHCQFLHICSPKLEASPDDAPRIMTKANDGEFFGEVQELLRTCHDLEEERKRAEAARKKLKQMLVSGQHLVCGDFMLKWRPHGRGWGLNVERVGEWEGK